MSVYVRVLWEKCFPEKEVFQLGSCGICRCLNRRLQDGRLGSG